MTESAAFRNQVLYFRQDDWVILCKPLIEKLTTGTFEIMTNVHLVIFYRPTYTHLAFLVLGECSCDSQPAQAGFFFCATIAKRDWREAYSQPSPQGIYHPAFHSSSDEEKDAERKSINQILSGAFSILTYERVSPTDIYSVLA